MINASKRSLLLCIALLMPFIYLLSNSTDYHPPLKLVNSPFTFTETEITAHPGETVQICVDKIGGGLVVFGTTSIVVDAVGNTSPHLSGFAPVTLFFPAGMTQACFEVVLAPSELSNTYRLGISNTDQEMSIDIMANETEVFRCGVIVQTNSSLSLVQNADIVYDRFGASTRSCIYYGSR